MRNMFVLENFEARKLLSAAASTVDVQHIGATSGLTAQAAVPTFTEVHGTAHDSNKNLITPDPITGFDRDTSLKITVSTNGTGSIDNTHLFRIAITITNLDTNYVLKSTGTNADISKVITSGGGDVIIVQFKNLLAANTRYKVELNGTASTASGDNRIRTSSGSGYSYFADTSFNFTTGSYYAQSTLSSAFTAAALQANAGSHGFTAVTMGPTGSNKLYAADTQGYIYAFDIGSDGTLGTPTVISTIRNHFGGDRLITGIVFKPSSTPTVQEMWVSSGEYAFGNNPSGSDPVQQYADNFTGEVDALSGTSLQNLQQLVVNIPRSVKDHTNNQIVFSPDGRSAYFGVAAMNAMGAADSTWGNRPENIYSATIMQVRVGGASGIYTYMSGHGGPVNLLLDNVANPSDPNNATGVNAAGQTVGTHYNIFKGSNPVRIYADGIRNDFDMVFASNGHLYAAINGSSAGGNTPATPSNLSTVPTQNRPDKDVNGTTYTGPTAPALTNVPVVEEDTLLDVKNGAYYGHPNPARGEYILDGANPTSGTDPYEFASTSSSTSGHLYATGQQTDRNYTTPIYDFGQDYSPDGIIQYKSVGGKNSDLNNYLLVARYSSGGDIFALQPNSDGSIGKTQARIPGLTSLDAPLDLTEDMNTGNLYIAVLNDETGAGSIQLVKPTTTSSSTPQASANVSKLSVYVTPGDKNGESKSVTITNTGTAPMTFNPSATKITGANRKNWVVTNLNDVDTTIAAGDSITLTVKGVMSSTQTGTLKGNLAISLNDPSLSQGYLIVHVYVTDAGASAAEVSSTALAGNSQLAAAKSVFADGSLIDQLGLNA